MTKQEHAETRERAHRGPQSATGRLTPEFCTLLRETVAKSRTTCLNCGREIRWNEWKGAACIYCGRE